MQDQIMLYIRENLAVVIVCAGAFVLCLLLLILFQVSRTRREVHKICKKIRRYFDVVLTEEEGAGGADFKGESEEDDIPAYRRQEEWQKQQEDAKAKEDAKLLMDVISEVF